MASDLDLARSRCGTRIKVTSIIRAWSGYPGQLYFSSSQDVLGDELAGGRNGHARCVQSAGFGADHAPESRPAGSCSPHMKFDASVDQMIRCRSDVDKIGARNAEYQIAAYVSASSQILSHGDPPSRMVPNRCLGSPVIVLLRLDDGPLMDGGPTSTICIGLPNRLRAGARAEVVLRNWSCSTDWCISKKSGFMLDSPGTGTHYDDTKWGWGTK